jgi:methylmalonyl-CoA mutase cobalamin-binding subunit
MNRAILATLPTDCHTWNLIYLQLILEEMNYRVENLGPCTAAATLIRQMTKEAPDVIVISTINGSACHDAISLIHEIRRALPLLRIPVAIGGNLDLGLDGEHVQCARLAAAGYDAVFPRSSSGNDLRRWIQELSAPHIWKARIA